MRWLISCRELPGCFEGIVNAGNITNLYVDTDFDRNVSEICATTTNNDCIVLCKSDFKYIKKLFEYLVGELSSNMTYGVIDLRAKYKQIKKEGME